jgi:S-adenosylmethionine:diacylglycerol 3-amino-3-carboxypropyl transferase
MGPSRLGASECIASDINFYSYRCRPSWRDTRQSEKLFQSLDLTKVAIAVLILSTMVISVATGARHPIDLKMRWNFVDSRRTSQLAKSGRTIDPRVAADVRDGECPYVIATGILPKSEDFYEN